MAANIGDEDDELFQWLRDKLRAERENLESRHESLLKEFVNRKAKSPSSANTNTAHDPSPSTPFSPPVKVSSKDGAAGNEKGNPSAPTTIPKEDAMANASLITEAQSNNESKGFLGKLVSSKQFELTFATLIVINLVVMAVESQYNGLGAGYKIGYPGYTSPAEDVWPGVGMVLEYSDYFFATMYTIELALKIVGLKEKFFDAWNVLDLVVVGLWYFDHFTQGVQLPFDVVVLRLLRLAKLLRMVKLAKSFVGFDHLLLILQTIRGAVPTMIFSFLVLFSALLLFAFLMNQLLVNNVVLSDGLPMETRQKTFGFFGTFSRSMFSMFELTLASWVPIGRFLMDDVHESFVIFSIAFKCLAGYALVNVINGCFMKEVFKIAAADDLLMVLEKAKEKKKFSFKMEQFFKSAGPDSEFSIDEFEKVCSIGEVKLWLGALGLDVSDATTVFHLMDVENETEGSLSQSGILKGVSRLKGPARSLDMYRFQDMMVTHLQSLQASVEALRSPMSTTHNL